LRRDGCARFCAPHRCRIVSPHLGPPTAGGAPNHWCTVHGYWTVSGNTVEYARPIIFNYGRNEARSFEPALWEGDADPAGFHFVDADNADDNVIAFLRSAPNGTARGIICVCNFAQVGTERLSAGCTIARALPGTAHFGFNFFWRKQFWQRRGRRGRCDPVARLWVVARFAASAARCPVAGSTMTSCEGQDQHSSATITEGALGVPLIF
jgi:hypothetical protein